MGDFSAHIRIKMDLVGKKYKTDMSINYSADDCCGVDRSVAEFFRNAHEDAQARFADSCAETFAEQDARELERTERAELERLRTKYE